MASPQGSQPKGGSQLSRSASRALRTLGTSEEIQCTKTLIQAYNDSDDEDAKGIALHRWLEAYVDEFSKHKAECVRENWIREYALLAMINVKTGASVSLVRRVYVSLRSCIKIGEYCCPVIVVALDNMLRIMDSKIVAKEAQSLVSLANDLLSLTDPQTCIFTRDTYESHMACLLTLERILIVLHGVECDRSKQRVVDFFQDRLKTQLKAIVADQNYYPFVYSTQLIKYNIENLIKGSSTAMLLNAGRRAFYAICGGLYLFHGIRELAVMRLDFAAMEAGVQKMNQAFSGLLDTKAPGLREVVHAASKSETTKDFSYIFECYKKHKRPSFMDGMTRNKLKIVKFALVSHLTLFATESSASNLANQAFCLLSNLAVNDDTKQWRADSDIYECLLDSFACIGAKKNSLRHDCLQLLHQMENSSIQNQRTMKDWRGADNIEQKLENLCDNDSEIATPALYAIVRKQLDLHLTHTHNVELKHKLIAHYQEDSFARVSLLIDDAPKRHIVQCDFHIVVYELLDAENRVTNNVSSTDGDQIAYNLERSRWVQTPIKLQDIFAKRYQKPSGPKEDVNHILVLGNPGTGKTTLSKRLCYDWTTSQWGSEFNRVYLLPVRQLIGSRLQLEKTLEGAIAILLFDVERKSQEEHKALCDRIKDELGERTTLLLIDGLDEANGNDAAEAIVKDALSRTCRVLVLSRPHNLGDLRSKMDAEIECLGLSDGQLRAYVRREVPSESEELIQFLKRSPLVWEIAKVPVNLQIICTLWNSAIGQKMKELKSFGLKTLYAAMVEYAWQRFEDKGRERVDRRALFSSLEIIAFTSISQGKVEIPRELVTKHSQGMTTCRLLLDSGFLLFHQEGQVFQFAHLSFHEFFAGQFLAKSLRDTEREIKKAKRYIADRKYNETSRVTLSFMTQCYCQEKVGDDEVDCIESLKQLLLILDEDPVEVVGFQHILLKMRALDAFLSVCGNCAEYMRSDEELQKVVSSTIEALDIWPDGLLRSSDERGFDEWHLAYYNRILEELGLMPSLFACLPEFLLTVLKHRKLWYRCEDTSKIARLASYAPEQRLRMMPSDGPTDYREESDDSDESDESLTPELVDHYLWFKLFADSGPDCAILALEQLKIACQNRNKHIRTGAVGALPWFLKVLPEQEDLHSMCINAMNHRYVCIREGFMEELENIVFEPNSVAANLVWNLVMEATRDSNKDVRIIAFRCVVREDQTSEASIEKMIAVLQDFASRSASDSADHEHRAVLKAIHKLLRRFPAKFTLFLPYLARCGKDSSIPVVMGMIDLIEELPSFLPTAQQRELGEMISKIYRDVERPEMRSVMVSAIYNIGQKVPGFMTDFPDFFLATCNDTDEDVSRLAKVRERMTLLTSVEGVDAINEVFWDQTYGVKCELLEHIQQEGLINAETAEVVMEMAVNCMVDREAYFTNIICDALLSVSRIICLSTDVLRPLLYLAKPDRMPQARTVAHLQPLDRLIKYFWVTADQNAVPVVAQKLMLASVTYKDVQGGKSIVSIVERGKKTEQEVSSELVEKLIMLVKDDLSKFYGDLFA